MSSALRRVKEELVACARRAYETGLQVGNGGNLSGRVPDTDLIVIKASASSFAECTVENLVTVNLGGDLVDGNGFPSRELPTHLVIYRKRPDVHGIFHTHSPWAIACAQFASSIPVVTFHAETKLGRIPVLNVVSHTRQEVARAVESLLATEPDLRVFVQARHGIFSFAETITLAERNAELVEETAQIAFLTALGKCQQIDLS